MLVIKQSDLDGGQSLNLQNFIIIQFLIWVLKFFKIVQKQHQESLPTLHLWAGEKSNPGLKH